MKGNKKAFPLFLISCVLAVALIVTSFVLFARVPKNEVIATAEGATITRVARSYENDAWYYGDSEGRLCKVSEEGETLATIVIAEGKTITTVTTDPSLEGLFVLDEGNDFWYVTDEGETLNKTFIKNFAGGYYGFTADEDYLYFAVSAARYTNFVKYAKSDPGGDFVACGRMYSCFPQGANYAFQPVISGSIVGMYTDASYLYVITGEGQYHRIDKDLTLSSFAYMSAAELAEWGATRGSDGMVTLPRENYDATLYRTARKSLAAKTSTYDEKNERFYIASVTATFVALDKSFNEIDGYEIELPNTPASGAMAFHRESGTLYIGYENISSVTAIDTESGNVLYAADVAFYISGMTISPEGSRLLVICSGNNKDNPNYKELLSADVATMGERNLMNTLGVLILVAGLLVAVVSVFAGMSAFRAGFAEKLVHTVKGMLHSWLTYLIIIGSLAMLIMFCYYPGISSMILSFFDYTKNNPTMRFNNFDNYIQIFTQSSNLIAFRNMLIFLASDILTALIPPTIFAMCLAFMRNKHYGTFARVVLFLPTVLPGIATLLIWTRGIYGEDGVLNIIVGLLSGQEFKPIQFLQDFGLPSLIMMGFPFVGSYLIFYGALMNVPSSYYEAAELDGCPLMKRIGMIDLPMISSQIKYVFILSFIQSVQNFGRVLMTTDGRFGTQIPIVLMYKSLQEGNYGLSSAFATLMFLVLIVVTILNMKIQTEDWEV